MKLWNLFSSLSNALNSSQCLCSVPAVQLCFCSIFYSFAVNVYSKIGEGWALGSWGQEWSVRICSCPFFRFTKQKLVFAKFCKHSTLQFYWIVNSSAALQFLKIPFFIRHCWILQLLYFWRPYCMHRVQRWSLLLLINWSSSSSSADL